MYDCDSAVLADFPDGSGDARAPAILGNEVCLGSRNASFSPMISSGESSSICAATLSLLFRSSRQPMWTDVLSCSSLICAYQPAALMKECFQAYFSLKEEVLVTETIVFGLDSLPTMDVR